MWQLDTTQQTYTPTNATHWTWAKVSASALKYLKSQHSNVPSFIHLISSGKNKDKYDPTVYELGRELHKLTRYAFDKLKKIQIVIFKIFFIQFLKVTINPEIL